MFAKIAFNFNKKAEHMVTGDQCLRKWNKLESNFKNVEDHKKKTGNDMIPVTGVNQGNWQVRMGNLKNDQRRSESPTPLQQIC